MPPIWCVMFCFVGNCRTQNIFELFAVFLHTQIFFLLSLSPCQKRFFFVLRSVTKLWIGYVYLIVVWRKCNKFYNEWNAMEKWHCWQKAQCSCTWIQFEMDLNNDLWLGCDWCSHVITKLTDSNCQHFGMFCIILYFFSFGGCGYAKRIISTAAAKKKRVDKRWSDQQSVKNYFQMLRTVAV